MTSRRIGLFFVRTNCGCSERRKAVVRDVYKRQFDFLHHLQIKNFQKRRVGIIENGSWAPTAGRMMSCMLSEMKNMEIMEHMVTIKSSMKKADLLQMEELAEELLATE